MKSESPKTPVAFKVAILNLVAGGLGVIFSLLSEALPAGASQVSIGLILLGIGEYINNPQFTLPSEATETPANVSHYFSRRRNVCALGNLFDIAGVLMIAIGAASLFL